jgi:hypothetical protein
MIWGEVSAMLTARQEHWYELQRMQLQGLLEAAQHERNLAAIRLQAELGVKTIEVQRDADVVREEASAFREAVSGMLKPTGIRWVDAWNASVRPAFATVVLALWLLALHRVSWEPSPWDLELMAAIAGFFFADRTLGKRGK